MNASPGYEPVVLGLARSGAAPRSPSRQHAGRQVDTNEQTKIFGAAQYTLWNQLYFKMVSRTRATTSSTTTPASTPTSR